MFIYVAALSVVFLAQSGVTAFIQAPAKRASRTRATWGGASKSDAAKHLAELAATATRPARLPIAGGANFERLNAIGVHLALADVCANVEEAASSAVIRGSGHQNFTTVSDE